MRRSLCFALVIVSLFCFGSVSAQYPRGVSKELDIPEKGWNKALLLSNGHTALLHLQKQDAIAIYIFDKNKELIASSKELSAYIDINMLQLANMKGFYEIGGELVLFMQQDERLKKNLVRIRYNMKTAKLTHEEVINNTLLTSGFGFTVVKYPRSDNYAVLSHKGIVVTVYDGRHNKVKQQRASMGNYTDGRNISSFGLLNAAADEQNNLTICYRLSKYQFNENNVVFALLREHDTSFVYNAVGLGSDLMPISASISYSDSQVQALILNRVWLLDGGFYDMQANASSLCVFNKKDLTKIYARDLENDYCSIAGALNNVTDSANNFIGTALSIAPVDGGIHVVSECVSNQWLYALVGDGSTVFQNVCMRRLDEGGRQTRKTTIFFNQYAQNFIRVSAMMKRQTEKALFRRDPESDYRVQFVSYDMRSTGKGTAIVLNDTYTAEDELITDELLFDNHKAEAAVFLYDKNESMTRKMLFTNATPKLRHAVLLESADYDRASDTYAALVSVTMDRKTKLCMSWSKLND